MFIEFHCPKGFQRSLAKLYSMHILYPSEEKWEERRGRRNFINALSVSDTK